MTHHLPNNILGLRSNSENRAPPWGRVSKKSQSVIHLFKVNFCTFYEGATITSTPFCFLDQPSTFVKKISTKKLKLLTFVGAIGAFAASYYLASNYLASHYLDNKSS